LNCRLQNLIAEKGTSREVTCTDNVSLEVETTRSSEMQPLSAQPLTVNPQMRKNEVQCGDEYLPSPEYTALSTNELPEVRNEDTESIKSAPIEPNSVEDVEENRMGNTVATSSVWTYFRKPKVPGVVGQMSVFTKEEVLGINEKIVTVEKTVQRESVHEAKCLELAAAKGWADLRNVDSVQNISTACNDKSLAAKTRFQLMVESRLFEVIFGLLIVASTVFVGLQVENDPDSNVALFLAVQVFFAISFTIELVMRVFAKKEKALGNDWMWNIFDACCVLLSFFEVVMGLLTIRSSSSNVLVFRFLRVLRLVRAARVIRLARFFRELRLMIHSVMACGVPLLWALSMLTIMIYIFAVFMTVGVAESLTDTALSDKTRSDLRNYYSTLGKTMFTLFAGVMGGADWQDFVIPLREVHWAYELLFCAYVAFTTLALLNVVTGIFVDSALSSAMHDRNTVIQEEMLKEGTYVAELKKIFQEADTDGSGVMTQEEMTAYLADKRVKVYMNVLGINTSEATGLFHLLDIDNRGQIDVNEFIMGCLRLKGEAKSIDVATLMYENKKLAVTVTASIQQIISKLEKLLLLHDRLALEEPQCSQASSHMIVSVDEPRCPRAPSCMNVPGSVASCKRIWEKTSDDTWSNGGDHIFI